MLLFSKSSVMVHLSGLPMAKFLKAAVMDMMNENLAKRFERINCNCIFITLKFKWFELFVVEEDTCDTKAQFSLFGYHCSLWTQLSTVILYNKK